MGIRLIVVLAALAALAACTASQRAVQVRVSTPTGNAVAGATVAWVCESSGDAGAVTGDDGVARTAIFNSEPKRCVVTVAKPGYHTRQLTVDDLVEPTGVELREVAP